MPTNPTIVLSSITARPGIKTTWSRILVIGFEAGGTAINGVIYECSNLTEVGTYFGLTGDIYACAQQIFEQDVDTISCLRVALTVVAAELVVEGSAQILAHHPVCSKPQTVVAPIVITDSGPAPVTPIYINVAATLNGHINMHTGSIFVTGVGNATVQYEYYNWTALETLLEDNAYEIDHIIFAEVPLRDGREYGDLTELITHCQANGWSTSLSGCVNAGIPITLANIITQIGWYTSKTVFAGVHTDTTHDVCGNIAGSIAVQKPWITMFWKQLQNLTMDREFTNTEINTTIEGAKANGVFSKGGNYIFSNGFARQTTGNYLYFDTMRTETWLTREIMDGVSNMLLGKVLPYTENGVSIVKSTIEGVLKDAYDSGAILDDYSVEVPSFSTIPQVDITNRVLNNVYVTATCQGHIQTINIALNLQI